MNYLEAIRLASAKNKSLKRLNWINWLSVDGVLGRNNKEDILAEDWFVQEESITISIPALRKALSPLPEESQHKVLRELGVTGWTA